VGDHIDPKAGCWARREAAISGGIHFLNGSISTIAARSVQARDKSKLDWVNPQHEHDRNRRCRRFGRLCGRDATHGNHGDLTLDGHQCRRLIVLDEAIFDRDVAPFGIAGFVQALVKRLQAVGARLRRCAAREPDHRQRRLLCACGEWPYRANEEVCCASQQKQVANVRVGSILLKKSLAIIVES
jgi:hypothetical protein